MPSREALDRRGRAQRGSSGLVERDDALAAIDGLLDEAQRGTGGALLIEGHPGMGKTRLYEAALDRARACGMRVLRAAGAELEQNMAFGMAAQLLSEQLGSIGPARRRELLGTAPTPVRDLAGVGHPAFEQGAIANLALSHSLFTTLTAVEDAHPTLLAIDDLHWSDPSSLEFLIYLLNRLDELSAAIVMTRRPGAGAAVAEVLDRIATHPRVTIETLRPLRSEAVRDLTERALGERADDAVVAACREATAGNPFYLHELLTTLREEHELSSSDLARHARALAPDAVTRIVRVRIGRLGPEAAGLARSVAILGDDVPLRHAANLASLPLEAASSAADALAAADILLAREPLRFVHPLVRQAVSQDIPASDRASRHLSAARLLDAEGAEAERIAAHLLLGRGQGDRWVVETLCAAARDATSRDTPRSAVGYLQRALEEPPPPDLQADVLAELGMAEAAAGLPGAAAHLDRAASAIGDRRRRAALALERGRALDAQGQHEQAAHAYDEGIKELGNEPHEQEELELHDQLQVSFVATANLVPALQEAGLERSRSLLGRARATPRTQGQRLLLAQASLQASFDGEPAQTVIELAERAWDDGRLISEAGAAWVGWRFVSSALCLAGALERAEDVAGAAVDAARRHSWPLAFATASFMRALPQVWQGQIDAALANLDSARDARRYGWQQFARFAAAQACLCMIEKGDLDRAEAVLTEDAPLDRVGDFEDAVRLYALAELRLAQGRPRDAYEHAIRAGRVTERTVRYLGYCPWQTTAAQAAVASGDRDRALELAREALARAERTGIPHQRIRTLRVLASCQEGAAAIATLRVATELGGELPPRLETIRALIDLGAALRRANQRVNAREPLGRAADLARAGGATALSNRARTELAATGARPRRQVLLSGPGSLTASERRIAELAAGGRSNREIAQLLFVTPKTVEYHLRNAYRKLGIETRRELPAVLTK